MSWIIIVYLVGYVAAYRMLKLYIINSFGLEGWNKEDRSVALTFSIFSWLMVAAVLLVWSKEDY